MHRLLWVFIVGALLAGCSPANKPKNLIEPTDSVQERIDKAIAFGTDAQLVKSIRLFPEIARSVDESGDVSIYRGLARDELAYDETKKN